MKIPQFIYDLWEAFCVPFVPHMCPICRESSDEGFFGKDILFEYHGKTHTSPFCLDCTLRVQKHVEASEHYEKQNIERTRSIDGVTAHYIFDYRQYGISEYLFCMKRIRDRENHGFAAWLIYNRICESYLKCTSVNPDEKTVLTFIPRSKKGLDRYKFDQCEEIAQKIAALDDRFTVRSDIFKRLTNKKSVEQKTLSAQDRMINASRSIVLNKDADLPERLIIIDDVVTTGSSAITSYRLLKSAGVKRVDFFFVASE